MLGFHNSRIQESIESQLLQFAALGLADGQLFSADDASTLPQISSSTVSCQTYSGNVFTRLFGVVEKSLGAIRYFLFLWLNNVWPIFF
jgi:hypothetical protein